MILIKAKSTYYVLLLGVMVPWGLNVIALKILVGRFEPLTVTSFRVFTAGLVVLFIQWLRNELTRLSLKEMLFICFVALFNVVGHHYTLALGLTRTTASNAGIILALVPLVTSILAVLFLKERFTLLRFFGFILGFAGVVLIVLRSSHALGQFSLGDVYIFLAVVTQAISFILIKKSDTRLHAGVLTGWMLVIGAGVIFLISLYSEPQGLISLSNGTWSDWLIFFASAVIATGFGHMTYNIVLQKIGPSESAIFLNLTPFFSLLGAALFLGESIGWIQMLGVILIVTGVLFGTGILQMKIKEHASSA